MLSLRVTSQKWTLFCVHYYSKLLMRIYINYIPLEAWVHCLQTATVNWCWDNISMEIFKKKMDFFQYLAHPPLWKKQESGKTWCHGFSFSCSCIRKQRLFKPPGEAISPSVSLSVNGPLWFCENKRYISCMAWIIYNNNNNNLFTWILQDTLESVMSN